MRRLMATAFAGWLFTSPVLIAQSDWNAVRVLVPGTPVRVTAGSRRASGTVQSATGTTLTIANTSGDLAKFDSKDIDRVETFVGDPHPRRKGAVKGALWGALLAVPATFAAEMGGSDRKDLPVLYCMIICGGAAIGAWIAGDANAVIVYAR